MPISPSGAGIVGQATKSCKEYPLLVLRVRTSGPTRPALEVTLDPLHGLRADAVYRFQSASCDELAQVIE